MGNYLHLFNTVSEYTEARESEYIEPWVSYTLENEEVNFNKSEYEKLLDCLRSRYLYAFMRLHRAVTPFETLGHIAGVNFVSVYIARQLLHTNVRIDPALSSGAAILHDIGKYGCRPEESMVLSPSEQSHPRTLSGIWSWRT